MKKKAVIFDLDGTLIDSIMDIAISTNQVLKDLGYQEHPLDAYEKFVGDGAFVLIKNALPKDTSDEILQKGLILFKKYYGDRIHKNTHPYDGIYEMLDSLKQTPLILCVLSNKPHIFTVEFIEHFFHNYPFIEVHGQKEEVPKKPDPIAAIQIAQSFETPCEEVYFVGDTMVDMQTAVNARMIGIGVLWGFRDEEELLSNGATFVVKHPLDILKIIDKK